MTSSRAAVTAGTEEAMLEAIMLLPAVAWVSRWLLTEDPGSQTVIIAPYAIDQALLKHLLHRRQWKTTLLSLTNETIIWGPSHVYLFWEAALKFVFHTALKKSNIFKWLTCNYWRPSKMRGNYFNLPPPPRMYILIIPSLSISSWFTVLPGWYTLLTRRKWSWDTPMCCKLSLLTASTFKDYIWCNNAY